MLYKFYTAIFSVIDNKYKRQLGKVAIISIVASILETVTISSIFPFMSLVTDPGKISSNKYYSYAYNLFHFSSSLGFITFFGCSIIILFIVKTIFNTFNNYISYSFGHDITKNIRIKLVAHYLHQKYIYYLRENKSTLADILGSTNAVIYAASGIGILITELFIIAIMYVILIIFNWKVMLGITIFVVINIVVVQKFLHPKIANAAQNSWLQNTLSIKFVNAIVHNYKVVKLGADKQIYINDYDKIIAKYHYYDAQRLSLDRQPKNLLELSGFLIMIGLILYQELFHGINSSSNFIPIISLLMLSFYRFLPSVTRIIEVKGNIAYVVPLMNRINSELNKKIEVPASNEVIPLKYALQLQEIKFAYNQKKNILSGVSLTINKGEHIAFIGKSGSGKSTLVDIIMGFYDSANNQDLYNISGELIVDGCILTNDDLSTWRQNIGYIPQEIYLFDGTVAENVVMNNEFNHEKVILALKKACIWGFLEQKEGLDTQVGDGGIMLSGGQKQRIGIARALYNDPEIIVMDEATSALDDHTEKQIIEELNSSAREKTIIMIAHRISSLKNCDKIYELNKGIIVNTYNDISEIRKH